MAIKDIFKISRKTFFNPTEWADLDAVRNQNRTIWTIIKGMFIPDKPVNKETFEEAMKRMGLNDDDVKEALLSYSSYAIVLLIFGFAIVLFAFYLLFFHRSFQGWLLAMSASGLSFAMAFKYDFWAFQIRNRKLGCTLAEWKRRKINNQDKA